MTVVIPDTAVMLASKSSCLYELPSAETEGNSYRPVGLKVFAFADTFSRLEIEPCRQLDLTRPAKPEQSA